uniref:Uncharacterized protein n=1 Tax=Anguilla anguilla TaxID=7936 RepID=A0A0E9RWF2_ANGAN
MHKRTCRPNCMEKYCLNVTAQICQNHKARELAG